jgi:large conductance mechanosensitive channel
MGGFKSFLLRGNVVDLAVGIVIGAAFGTVVSELVKDLITPLIAAVGGQPNFDGVYFTVNNSRFLYGRFVNALISFVIIALVVYYLIVLPYARFRSRFERPAPSEPKTRECPECLSKVPVDARRCAYCTVPLAAPAAC